MKNIFLTLTIGFILASCTDKKAEIKTGNSVDVKVDENANKTELEYVDRWNQIELAQTDDKYSEWGGDSDIILIYSDGKEIFANYSRFLGSYEPPMPPKENERPKKWFEYKKLEHKIDSIRLNNKEIGMIENAIMELTKLKLNSSSYQPHSGIVNSVISRDSSLIIKDYPSNKWKSFQQLKKSLTKK